MQIPLFYVQGESSPCGKDENAKRIKMTRQKRLHKESICLV